ncbi:nucleoside-diphosphate-sugar epimerase [Yamadazyma tenuis]|uniref:NADPH-dependent methylglyoxal reductase GRE2 n=1 Tax=Candida tenuis (strain ATCC 10573 / BCRC 21748 / CBS 615 / JCM 9827 / NBRC 10315 / NRRL Y-1498 / VKM Y-70) TaxID=590646 RepID=G3AZL9_CANTC|nr:NADPH-dependent methylglyoxal reductase GRE2 [Yamadazyma tenuis ATCC 10573]EGV65615.1 NADPH-dependent methylglyoxal reductase GRE2 [Yamadazyma tenuis ATCC 10573]WEJ96073.1 nucleoside-diphosphate-sugar epimerase [Yamadazyma tenuis]
MSTPVVFVSGFTSYIALHIVKKLLARKYKVIGSGRSQSKSQHYADIINDPNFSFVVVAQLDADDGFDEVFKQHQDITYVLHVASPLILDPKDPEKELLLPAVHGTTNIMRAAQKYGPNVKRVVITCSYAAHCSPLDHYGKPDSIITEESWSTITYEQSLQPQNAYWGSKKLAEEAAWKYVKENSPKYEVTSFAPLWCFGPQAYEAIAKESVPSTLSLVGHVLKKDNSLAQALLGSFSDVRDVAEGHVLTIESKEAAGKRLMLANGRFEHCHIVDLIRKNFPQLGIPEVEVIPYDKVGAPTVDCEATKKLLKLDNLISLEQSLVDSVNQFLETGVY